MLAIKTHNLMWLFHNDHGVRGPDLAVPAGSVYAFL